MADEAVKPKGVTLWYKRSRRSTMPNGKKVAELVLDGEIESDEVWAVVEKSFTEGLFVGSTHGFKDEMIDVLKDELRIAAEKNRALEDENRMLRGQNAVLGSQNGVLLQAGRHNHGR